MNKFMLIVENNRWIERAHCANGNVKTSTFFEKYEKGDDRVKRKTIAMCESLCPVKNECLEYGMKTKSVGLFGGQYLENGRIVRSGRMKRG